MSAVPIGFVRTGSFGAKSRDKRRCVTALEGVWLLAPVRPDSCLVTGPEERQTQVQTSVPPVKGRNILAPLCDGSALTQHYARYLT